MRHALATMAAIGAALCLLTVPALVLGHVELTNSSPTAGDNLDTAPSEVSVTFDDELDPDQSSFMVTDAHGHEVGNGEVDLTVADRNVMNGTVTISVPGVYTVRYTVAGVDGHVLEGSFSFGFQATAEIPEPTGDEHGPDTALPQPRSSVPALVGLLLLAAGGLLAMRRRGEA